MKICVYGAGAVGGFVAANLARVSGVEISVVARGAQLEAIRDRGLRLVTPNGEFCAPVVATDRPGELGPQDYVFIGVKQHQFADAVEGITPLIGEHTAVLPPTTSIPYWYFDNLPGPFDGTRLERLDPGGRLRRRLDPSRVLGCVYWVATEVREPGVVHHDGRQLHFPVGEPDGSNSPRLLRLIEVMNRAGLNAEVTANIRGWIWAKMISSLAWNPVATLTLASMAEMNAQPAVMNIVRRIMKEADGLAAKVGINKFPIDIEQRIASARLGGHHKMSMLQDLQRGRPLELDALINSIEAVRELVDYPTPTIDDVYALLRLRADKHLVRYVPGFGK